MKNNIFTRLLAMLLAIMCLVSSAAVAVGAEETEIVIGDNLTDQSIEDYKDTLNTLSYEEYQKAYFADAIFVNETLSFSLLENWRYVNGDIVVTVVDGDWKMTVGETVYDTIEEALAAKDEKGIALYEKDDLPYVDTFNGTAALYTPGIGSVTWTLDIGEKGIDAATLFSIALDYFPVIAKNSAIEREFYINGTVPFSEARALRLSKIWESYQQGSSVGEGGSVQVLQAIYTLTNNDNLDDIKAKADEAKLTYTVADDGKSIAFDQPAYVTPKGSTFIEQYGLRFFATDINRNEMRPTQLQSPEWTRYILSDSNGFSHVYEGMEDYASSFFGFVLTPDDNGLIELTLESVNEPMALSMLELLPYENQISYEDYRKEAEKLVGTEMGDSYVKLEAENTNHTSTNVVYPIEDRASALTSPADTTRTVLNTIGTEKWATSGQWVEYSFTVDSEGWYDIYARFKQSYLDGMYVSRALKIYTNYKNNVSQFIKDHGNSVGYYNGLPFAEAAGLRYNYGTDWSVTKLNSTANENTSYQVYFRAGVVYTLRLEVTLGSMSDMVRDIEDILNILNTAYLDIIKLTGTTPDDYRDYSFYRLLPDTLSEMNAQKKALRDISDELRDTANVASTYTGICDKLVDLLERMLIDGGEPIAKNLDTFKSYVGSLGTFLSDAKTQPLQLDYLTIQGADIEAPVATPNFFQAFWHELMSFIQSFFRDYNTMGATETVTDDTRSVSVWVPYGRDQANVIRNLSTNGFTQQYGISVDLKLVNGGTLLPSILAGMGPDVYLGLDQGTVINYAIRGALANIETMEEDFDAFIGADLPDSERVFNDAAMTVLKIADADGVDHYYGLPETQSFSMMFVRLDVLAELKIEIPKTWDDLYVAQSVLESNNMEIGATSDYKYFLYQMGGDLWADGGMRINLDSEAGLAAFNKTCEMFTQYSFPYQYDGANRFRTGEMPIILAGYTGLYNQLKVFATELDGCWTFVPIPGWKTVNEDGTVTINNDSISGVSAVVMIAAVKDKEAAWDYMCWYTGKECQADYANEMVAIMGDSAKHSTANRDALVSLPWTYAEYTEVIKQFDNLASVENYPGYYYIDRYTSFAFL
ncbi:MAG: extracellular solute-binding protein [Clostridia bacterium]|nr:extracellular solute-binding protein [Clostridia bacterium]